MLKLKQATEDFAKLNNYDIYGYIFDAAKENSRLPRTVKVGIIQNSIACPTTANIIVQRDAIYEKVGKLIDAAGEEGVNVLCLQEAWSKSMTSMTSK